MMAKACVITCLLVALVVVVHADDASLKAGAANNERNQGDAAFKAGQLKKAIGHYDKAVELGPNDSQNYYRRATALMIDRKYSQAKRDLDKALEILPDFHQAQLKRARMFMSQGSFDSAMQDLQKLSQTNPSAEVQKQLQNVQQGKQALQVADHYFNSGHFAGAKEQLDVAITHAPDSVDLLMKRAECRRRTGDNEGVLLDTGHALKVRSDHIPALHLRGVTYFYMNDHEIAMRHFREGLRMDPEHKLCKAEYRKLKKYNNVIKAADEDFTKRKWKDAVEGYEKAAGFDPDHKLFNAKMYLKLCRCHLKIRKPVRRAVEWCSKYMDTLQEHEGEKEDRIQAFVNRAEALIFEEDFEEAVRDYERAKHLAGDRDDILQGLDNAQRRLKMSKRKDYYKILGVSNDADDRTIRKAYKRAALKYHPDKLTTNDESEKEKAVKKFREIAEAYEILSDPDKRQRFDNGEDLEEQQQGHPGHHHHGFPQGFHFDFGGGNFHFG